MTKNKDNNKEFGDFQTPIELSKLMINIIKNNYDVPNIIIEPTCGAGNILIEAYKAFKPEKTIGIEINQDYCNQLVEKVKLLHNIEIFNDSIFTSVQNLFSLVNKNDICCCIGNPPWITNSELSYIGSSNVPEKANIKNSRGIEAITGKSNFDLAEHIIIKLMENLQYKNVIYAFLCKTSVARNILKYCWEKNIYYKDSSIYPIDAKKYFNANVDACFFIIDTTEKNNNKTCKLYSCIEKKIYKQDIRYFDNIIINDWEVFQKNNICGKSEYIWRNGIKHDCSKIMELEINDDRMINGLNEIVDIENGLLYPLYKSSDIANDNKICRKKVIITQKQINENTDYIRFQYPKTWKYLSEHIDYFAKRKSSVYKNKPIFSIFSIGWYCFLPYKIAISSLYKKIEFKLLLPENDKPIMVDDTCNFISFKTESEARLVLSLLKSKSINSFLNSIIFWDNKRPITTQILNYIDFSKVAEIENMSNEFYLLNENYTEQLTLFG